MIDCVKDCVNYGTSMCAYPKFKHHVSCINFKSKKISMSEEVKPSAKFLTSIALAVNDIDGEVRHIQLSIVQVEETREIRAFMDVVDPSKIKLEE